MEEEEKAGLTVREIVKIIISQKWLALLIAVIITVAGTLGLYLGYNAANTEYVRIFTVNIPGSDSTNPVFPDKSPFDYRDIISRDNLVTAKESGEEFKNIDIATMYSEREITIARSTNQIAGEQIETSYTIRVNAKYFADKNIASDYIDALVNMPARYLAGIAEVQDAYLLDYDVSDFYEDKIKTLQNQIEFLINGTQNLVTATGEDSSNIRLLGKLKKFGADIEVALGDLHKHLYVHDVKAVCAYYEDLTETLDASIRAKMREIEIIYGKLEGAAPTANFMQPSERVEQLASEISALEEERTLYRSYLAKYPTGNEAPAEGSDEFSSKLDGLKAEAEELTGEYETNLAKYFSEYLLISYDGALIMSGEINIIICILISLIAGIIIAAVSSFFIGIKRRRASRDNGGEPPAAEDGTQDVSGN